MSGKEQTISIEMLKNLDALYEETEDRGILGRRHTGFGILVEELRKIRRLVESGVTVKIEGTSTMLTTWKEFYDWAHERYHKLEEGSDLWIGDDNK